MKTPQQIVRAHIEVASAEAHTYLAEVLAGREKAAAAAAKANKDLAAWQTEVDSTEQKIQAFDAWLIAFPEPSTIKEAA